MNKGEYLEGLGLDVPEICQVLNKARLDEGDEGGGWDDASINEGRAFVTAVLQKIIDDPNVVVLDEEERGLIIDYISYAQLRDHKVDLCKTIKEKLG